MIRYRKFVLLEININIPNIRNLFDLYRVWIYFYRKIH